MSAKSCTLAPAVRREVKGEMVAPVLSGVRVVDVSRGIAGAVTTMCLADQGADVVRVVAPGRDALADEPGALVWGRGKQRILLDLGTAEGAAELEQLACAADVVVEDTSHATDG